MQVVVVIRAEILVVFLIFVYEIFILKRNLNIQPQVGPDPREKPLIFCLDIWFPLRR